MMKKFLLALAAGLVLVWGCGKTNPEGGEEDKLSVEGAWELSGVATKVSVGSVDVSVYMEFASGKFTLYQKIGEGRYSKFDGTYTLSDKSLSGKYSDGTSWGPYTAAMSGSNLTLTSAGGREVDTYKKISSIPSTVTENTY